MSIIGRERLPCSKRWVAAGLLCVILAGSAAATGLRLGRYGLPAELASLDSGAPHRLPDFGVFWQAWGVVDRQFYAPAPPNHQQMTYGAIRGLLESLADPHSGFFAPPEHVVQTERFQGSFGGIGASLAMEHGAAVLVDVQVNSPAERAGVRKRDLLLSVDGHPVADQNLNHIALLIRGHVGSAVELQVRHSDGQIAFYSLLRESVEAPSVSWQPLSAGIFYARIGLFTARTSQELASAMQSIGQEGAQALVLDLRGNGGGLVQSASEVLGSFLSYGIAYRELDRTGNETRHAVAIGAATVAWPLAVLVDGATASAAEIVAAAIQDYDRGILIGQRTFGKGSVQSVFTLGDGSSIHLTTAHWQSPEGQTIEGHGIDPDIVVAGPLADDCVDPGLEIATEHLAGQLGLSPNAFVACPPLQHPETILV